MGTLHIRLPDDKHDRLKLFTTHHINEKCLPRGGIFVHK